MPSPQDATPNALRSYEDFAGIAAATVNGVPIINLGGYRKSEVSLEWTGGSLNLRAGATVIGFYPKDAAVLRDFINAALAGEFGSKDLRLDLA